MTEGARDEVGDEATVRVERIAHGGDAIARLPSGRTLFVDRGLPGDAVRVRVEQVRKRFARASCLEIVEPGSERVTPGCPVEATCGGCRFWAASYEAELRWKVEAMRQSVARLAREVAWPEPEVVRAPAVEGYRERARYRVDDEGRTGFLASGSRDLVATDRCAVVHPDIDEARAFLGPVLAGVPGVDDVFFELDHERAGVAALIAFRPDAWVAGLRAVRPRLERRKPMYGITTVVATMGGRPNALIGDGSVLRRRPCGATEAVVRDPVGAFSQANPAINARLQQDVLDAVEPATGRRVVELFAGSGNFTFPLLGAGCDVLAYEGAARPVAAAERAWAEVRDDAPGNGRFVATDLRRPPQPDPFAEAEVVVLDPPRVGMTAPLAEAVARSSASRVVYVACDAAALARDVGRLAAHGWRVLRWTAYDMMPRTAHLELLVVLER